MKLLVAIDGQESAETALKHMIERRYPSDTQVTLIHVIPPVFADVKVDGIPDVVGQEFKEEKVILDNLSSALKDKLSINASSNIIRGDVAHVIAQECKRLEIDETIVPSHARHGFARLWNGSVADEIVDASPCAVLVLKIPAV